MVRRKPGTLLPLEVAILDSATSAARNGDDDFHGFAIARHLQERDGARRLTAHGTLYKALGRMEAAGLLESRWEAPEISIDAGRPRRRLYSVTPLGASALADARSASRLPTWRPGMVT